jgi:hypothetical protein
MQRAIAIASIQQRFDALTDFRINASVTHQIVDAR